MYLSYLNQADQTCWTWAEIWCQRLVEHMPFYPDNEFSSCSLEGERVHVFPANFYCFFLEAHPIALAQSPKWAKLDSYQLECRLNEVTSFYCDLLVMRHIYYFYITHIEIMSPQREANGFCIERPVPDRFSSIKFERTFGLGRIFLCFLKIPLMFTKAACI